jgi:hypothetical protein
VPITVVSVDPLAEAGVVGVILPAIVVAPVVPGVVRRVGKDQVDLAALAEQRRHRLQVVAFDEQVARLVLLRSDRVLLDGSRNPGTDAAGELARVRLAREIDADAAFVAGLDQRDQLIPRELVQRTSTVQRMDDSRRHAQLKYATCRRRAVSLWHRRETA